MERIAKFEKVSKNQYFSAFDGEIRAEYAEIKLPHRATVGSAGYDFYAPFDITLAPGETAKVPTGIRARMENGWVLLVYPRSSMGFKFRMQLDNTVGVIDSDYYYSDNEGHIFVKITNDGRQNKTIEIKKGEAFVQGVFTPFGICEDDDAQDIRNGGMGSTTKKA